MRRGGMVKASSVGANHRQPELNASVKKERKTGQIV